MRSLRLESEKPGCPAHPEGGLEPNSAPVSGQPRKRTPELCNNIDFMRFRLLACALSLFFSALLEADVALPNVLADHMVLQRGLPVHIWGKAAPGELVTVSFRSAT